MNHPEVGRNDPCWCGSGKKYKKCHAAEDRQNKPLKMGSIGQSLRNAFQSSLCLKEVEREKMRAACQFNASLMDLLREHVGPGVTTNQLDKIAYDYTMDHGHKPACLGYKGYPKTICTSINEVVCHGIPDDRELVDGDIVNLDMTTIVDGWYGDQSETFFIGEVDPAAKKLVQCTFECLWLAIRALTPSCTANVIGTVIDHHAHSHNYSVVEEYQGHGIGRKFHQDPNIVHYATPVQERVILAPGMCFTIEPMINIGTHRCELDHSDGWTVRTADRKLTAQFEHTILMTESGPEIMTLTKNGPQEGHQFV